MKSVALIVLLWCSGCQNAQVRKHSALLSGEVPALYYQQVLDNVAMAIAAPNNLPYFGLPAQGTSTNSRLASAGFNPTWTFITPAGYFFSRWLLSSQSAPLTGSNQNQAAIQISPISDPDRLELLRLIFHATANNIKEPERLRLQEYYRKHSKLYYDYSQGVFEIASYEKKLVAEMKINKEHPCEPALCKEVWKDFPVYKTKPFWLHVESNKHHVPKDACYVGHYCDTYVWVSGESSEALRQLTMAALDVASIELNGLKLHGVTTKPVSETRYELNRQTGKMEPITVEREVITTETDVDERNPRQSQPWPYPAPPNAPMIGP
jgi:hypothetical protein